MGEYTVSVPHISKFTGTNSNPIIRVHECGRIVVKTAPPCGEPKGEIWIDCVDGSVYGTLLSSNENHGVNFEVDLKGTNFNVTTEAF